MRARPPPWGAGGGSGPKACGLGSGGRLQRPGCGTPDAPVGHGGSSAGPRAGAPRIWVGDRVPALPSRRIPLRAGGPARAPLCCLPSGAAGLRWPRRPRLPSTPLTPLRLPGSCSELPLVPYWGLWGFPAGAGRVPAVEPSGFGGTGPRGEFGGGRAPGAAFLGLAGVGGWSGGSAFPGALCSGGPWGPELTDGAAAAGRAGPDPVGPSSPGSLGSLDTGGHLALLKPWQSLRPLGPAAPGCSGPPCDLGAGPGGASVPHSAEHPGCPLASGFWAPGRPCSEPRAQVGGAGGGLHGAGGQASGGLRRAGGRVSRG